VGEDQEWEKIKSGGSPLRQKHRRSPLLSQEKSSCCAPMPTTDLVTEVEMQRGGTLLQQRPGFKSDQPSARVSVCVFVLVCVCL
jgi:hypothetical protein